MRIVPELLNVHAEWVLTEPSRRRVPHAHQHVRGIVGTARCEAHVLPLHIAVRDGRNFVANEVGVGVDAPALRRQAAAELLAHRHPVSENVGDQGRLARTGARAPTDQELRADRPRADGAGRGPARSPEISAGGQDSAERPTGLARPLRDGGTLTEDACERLVRRDLKSIAEPSSVARGGVRYCKRGRIISNRGRRVRADDARCRNRDGSHRAAAAIAAIGVATADGGGNY